MVSMAWWKSVPHICTNHSENSIGAFVSFICQRSGGRLPLSLGPAMLKSVSPKLIRLQARECISFKLCLLMYKAIHGLALCYLSELCIPVSTVSNLSALRSIARGDLVMLRTRLQLGNREFCVAGPVAWNGLPLHICSSPALSTFKTHLFSRSYFTDYNCF